MIKRRNNIINSWNCIISKSELKPIKYTNNTTKWKKNAMQGLKAEISRRKVCERFINFVHSFQKCGDFLDNWFMDFINWAGRINPLEKRGIEWSLKIINIAEYTVRTNPPICAVKKSIHFGINCPLEFTKIWLNFQDIIPSVFTSVPSLPAQIPLVL